MVRQWFAAAPLVWVLAMHGAWPALAQQSVSGATVSGTVRDGSEGVVRGATVTIRNHDTGRMSQAATDEAGRFRLLYLPVGDYHLSAEAPGFATANVNLRLTIGEAVDVPIALAPAVVTEAVAVSAAAPVVEATRTQVAETISPHEIDTLPLNGRNYLDLALLAPNVSRTNTRSADRFAETSAVPGTGLSVAGQRNLGNSFIVDGLSANDDAADLAGTYYSEEVIREFEVVTSGGAAEFGRASAGTINVVTQSGTNELRGRAYGFFRNDAFDAKNALAATKDRLTQSQSGVTLGGPIVANRTFWFANFERTVQDRTGIVTMTPANVAAINGTLDAFGYGGPRVTTGPYSTGYHTLNVFARVDHQLTPGTHGEFRYSFYDVGSPNARNVGGLNDSSRGTRLDDRDETLAANLLSSLTVSVVNELRGQWARSRLAAPVNDVVGPAVNISGVANFGTATFSPTARDLDVYELSDGLTLQRGAHLLKLGGDLLYNRATVAFPGARQGVYTFGSLAAFARGSYINVQQAFGNAAQFQSNPNLAAFAQDEWRAGPHVTVSAGVRYDLQWLPSPIQLDTNNVSPRLGLAYAPNSSTVVRASAGVYFDRIPLRAVSNALQRDGVNYRVAVLSPGQPPAPAFPAVLSAYPPGVLTAVTTIDPSVQNGRSEQFAVQIERSLGSLASVTLGYSRLRGHNIIMSRNVNVPTLSAAQAAALGVPNLGRPDPTVGNNSQYQSVGDSWFDGLTAAVASRTQPWGTVRLSYTLSRALDDAGNAFFSSPQDNFDIPADKGPSDNDQRHRFVASGTFGDGTSARLRHRLGGLRVGYVFSYATGVPFNVQTGTDRNNDTNVNDRPAGVGRNSARQPATSALDLRVSRDIRVARSSRIEVILEGFNVLSHVNVLNVNNIFGTGTVPLATFGQPTLAADPRQMQLGVRWTF